MLKVYIKNLFILSKQARLIAFLILFFIFFSTLSLYAYSYVSGDLILNNIDIKLPLSIASFIIFVLLIVSGTINRNFYFFCLPLVALAVPNSVNDLLPAFWAGPQSDRGAATVSLITHLDLYLLAGIFLFSKSKGSLRHNSIKEANAIIFTILFVVFFSIFCWLIFDAFTDYNPLLFFGNSFQVRYLIYVSLLIKFINKNDIRNFNKGLLLAVSLVIIEALIYTISFQNSVLTSGNFGTNTLGVLLGFSLIYISSIKNIGIQIKIFIMLAISLALFLTGTRSAIIAIFLSYILYIPFLKIGFIRLSGLLLIFSCFLLFVFKNELIFFLDPFLLLIETDYSFLEERGLVGGELSSITTRLSLWITSFDLIKDFPFGIGLTQFNFLKLDYGFMVPVFIDPHNDYINFILKYGIINGSIMIYILFVHSLVIINAQKSYKLKSVTVKLMFFVILAGLSNSNLDKHQFFFLFIFILFGALKDWSNNHNIIFK